MRCLWSIFQLFHKVDKKQNQELPLGSPVPESWLLLACGARQPHVASAQGVGMGAWWLWEFQDVAPEGMGRAQGWGRVGCSITSLETSSRLAVGFLCLGAKPQLTTFIQLLGHWRVILAA